MNLKGKTALVTGASSGIGKSFAYLLASKGVNLVLVARTASKLENISADIQSQFGVSAAFYTQDLSMPNAGKTLYDKIKNASIEIDILINNAGFGKWGKFESVPLKEYRDMLQLNMTSLMELCYLFIEDFKVKPEAGIINVGSTASFVPGPYYAVYCATKHFVFSFTEGLVGEFANTNIMISCLCPAATESAFANIALAGKHTDHSKEKAMPSDEVAQIGLDAFLAQKHYVIAGRKMQLRILRLLPRRKMISSIADYWKKRLNIN